LRTAIAEATERSAEANRRAEEEKTARLKLAEEYGARHLTDDSVRTLVNSLKGKVRKLTVIRILDTEASLLGVELVLAFRVAGIETSELTMLRLEDGSYSFPSGIYVMYDQKEDDQKEEAEAVTTALNSIHIGPAFNSIGSPTNLEGKSVFPQGTTPFPSVYVGLKWPVAGGPDGPRSRFLNAPPADLYVPKQNNNPTRE
jgi:hypothetical protein